MSSGALRSCWLVTGHVIRRLSVRRSPESRRVTAKATLSEAPNLLNRWPRRRGEDRAAHRARHLCSISALPPSVCVFLLHGFSSEEEKILVDKTLKVLEVSVPEPFSSIYKPKLVIIFRTRVMKRTTSVHDSDPELQIKRGRLLKPPGISRPVEHPGLYGRETVLSLSDGVMLLSGVPAARRRFIRLTRNKSIDTRELCVCVCSPNGRDEAS